MANCAVHIDQLLQTERLNSEEAFDEVDSKESSVPVSVLHHQHRVSVFQSHL